MPPTLELHLKSNNLPGDSGDTISTWEDQSGNGRDAAAIVGEEPLRVDPTGALSYKPAAHFAASGDKLDVPAGGLDIPLPTYFIVGRMRDYPSVASNCWFANKLNTNPATFSLRGNGSTKRYTVTCRVDGSESTSRQVESLGWMDLQIHVHCIRYNGTALEYWIDGVYQGSDASAAGTVDTDNDGVLSLGNHPSVDSADDAELSEIRVYSGAMTDAEREAFEAEILADYPQTWPRIGLGALISDGANKIRWPGNIFEYDSDTWGVLVHKDTAGSFQGFFLATAPKSDPHNWTLGTTAVLTAEGGWEGTVLGSACVVVEDDDSVSVFYDARDGGEIGFANVSSMANLGDLDANKSVSNPVFSGQGVGWEEYVRQANVILVDGTYHMYYDGREGTPTSGDGAIGHATSADKVTWVRDGANPVLDVSAVSNTWEDDDVGAPNVVWSPAHGAYLMAYSAFDNSFNPSATFPHHIGLAINSGLAGDFTRINIDNPVINHGIGDAGAWDTAHASKPIIFIENDNLHIYYTGGNGTNVGIGGRTLDTIKHRRLSRTFDFSGLSGDVIDGDPLWLPVEGHVAGDASYLTLSNGQPGFRVKTGLKRMLFTGLPLGAFRDFTPSPATFMRVSFTVKLDRDQPGLFTSGGPMLYHYSNGNTNYGTDGKGYFLNISLDNSLDDINYKLFAKTGTETWSTLVDWSTAIHLTGFTGDFFLSWRWTLTKSGADKRMILEYQIPGAGSWSSLEDFTILDGDATDDTADMLGLGWRSGADELDVYGLTVEWDGPSLVAPCIGQSEFNGPATIDQGDADVSIYSVDRQGDFNSPLTDPWSEDATAHATWTGIDAGNTPEGSFIPRLTRHYLKGFFPTQCWVPLALNGGLEVLNYAPPAIATRYDTTNRFGALSLMATILAGDGRTPGQTLVFPFFQGTRDAIIGTSQANYESRFDDIADRIVALWPTAVIPMIVQGDRSFHVGATEARSIAIRAAQLARIAARSEVHLWIDDQERVGAPGAGTGWPDSDDGGLHPGEADNVWLADQGGAGLLLALGLGSSSKGILTMGMM